MSRSSSARPATSWSSRRRPPRDDGYFGDLLADLGRRAAARPRHRRRRARRARADRDGLPGLVEGGLRAGHGQGDPGLGQRAGRLRRRGSSIPATWSSPTTTACASCRAPRRPRCSKATEAREAKEATERQRLAAPASSASTSTTCATSSPSADCCTARSRWRSEAMLRAIPCTLMRGGTSKGLYFLRATCPRPARARRGAARGHGLARSAPDRRHGRRAPADQQGRGRQPVRARGCGRRLPVPAGRGRQGRGHRRAELRQHPRRRRPLRDRARPGARRRRDARRCASTWSTPADRGGAGADARRRGATTRATRGSTACRAAPRRIPHRLSGRRRLLVRRAAARPATPSTRIDGVEVHLHRQRHARACCCAPPMSARPATSTARRSKPTRR